MSYRFTFTASVAALALSAGLAAAETTVDFAVAEYSAKTGPYFQEVADAFTKENPDIKVNVQVIPWDSLLQRLTTDITGGTAPDIAIIGTRWLLDFTAQGVAEPLDGYLTPEFKGAFIDTFLSPSVIDGKTMGLPVAASARAMVINKHVFEKAGATAPKTWDEFLTAAKAIKEKVPDVAPFALQGKEIETDAYYYYSLWTHGGDILTADGKSGLDSPEAIEAAKFYKMLIDEKLTEDSPTNYNREDLFGLFKRGQVASVIAIPPLVTQIKEEAPDLKYEVIPIPAGKAQATYGVTDTLMMFADSDAKDAAWKFIEFAYKDDWRKKFDMGEGFLPVTKAVAGMDEFARNPDLAGFAAGLPNAHFAPLIEKWEEMADATSRNLQKIYLGEVSPEDGMKAAAAEVNALRGK